MGKLILHADPDPERLERERALKFQQLSTGDKLKQLFALIDLTIRMNGGRPIKEPQGKGIIIRKPVRQDGSL